MTFKVPKCKECKYYKYGSALTKSRGSIDVTLLKNYHYCTIIKESYPIISSQELITSPKWCPRRPKVPKIQ